MAKTYCDKGIEIFIKNRNMDLEFVMDLNSKIEERLSEKSW
ncbi:hypothetical protein [Wukongibacter baidiensis]